MREMRTTSPKLNESKIRFGAYELYRLTMRVLTWFNLDVREVSVLDTSPAKTHILTFRFNPPIIRACRSHMDFSRVRRNA